MNLADDCIKHAAYERKRDIDRKGSFSVMLFVVMALLGTAQLVLSTPQRRDPCPRMTPVVIGGSMAVGCTGTTR